MDHNLCHRFFFHLSLCTLSVQACYLFTYQQQVKMTSLFFIMFCIHSMHRWQSVQSHMENYIMPCLIQFCSQREMSSHPFLHSYWILCSLFDRLLNETTKRTGTLGVTQHSCLLLNGEHAGTFPQQGFFKRACTAVPNKGSTVGQLPVELQPFFCGGLGQIRPHNCLSSQTVTAAYLRLLKSTTDCCSFGEPSGKEQAQ